VAARRVNDARVDAAIDALSRPGRLRAAEARVAALAPQLGFILARALEEGGWLEAQDHEVRRAASASDPEERVGRTRDLLADQARTGMLVGVAVGWELARELDPGDDDSTEGA
jgi:hypothetical protein